MPKQPEKRKPGRPKMAKSEAKGRIVPVRFTSEDLERLSLAASIGQKTVSDWIRTAVHESLQRTLATLNSGKGSRSTESRKLRKTMRKAGFMGGLRGKETEAVAHE